MKVVGKKLKDWVLNRVQVHFDFCLFLYQIGSWQELFDSLMKKTNLTGLNGFLNMSGVKVWCELDVNL